jgi:peptidoglycan hydrolase-like protein with peptidoglycan-binding domain
MPTHTQAANAATEGFMMTLNRQPTRVERQPLQGVGWLESQYGAGWRGAGVGSNNVGAVQAGRPPCDPSRSFLYTDTHPNADGSSTSYSICFKKYPSLVEGFADVAELMYVRMYGVLAAAQSGDLHAVSAALHAAGYYEGWGATVAVRVANHYHALRAAVNAAAVELGEKMPDGFDPLARVMKLRFPPMRGDDVRRVQRVVGIDPDGWYGPKTRTAVRNFQLVRPGLGADGVCGLDTWHVVQEVERQRGIRVAA